MVLTTMVQRRHLNVSISSDIAFVKTHACEILIGLGDLYSSVHSLYGLYGSVHSYS